MTDGLRPQLALDFDRRGGMPPSRKQCRERCCSRARRHGREDFEGLRAYIESGGYATIREFEVYQLCVGEEVSLSQAAEILGIGYETVRDYLRNLRRRVRHPEFEGIHRARLPLQR